jgi:predicted Na+-dependent transporter
MPLIGFATVAVFNSVLDPLFAISLLIICASPGGSYSNWWCNLINADLALSVAMTTVSTIVSSFVLPLNIYLYIEVGYKALNEEKSDEILALLPYEVLGYTLANVIVAVISGLIFGYKFPDRMKIFNLAGTAAGFLSILLGVVASGDSCADPFGQPFVVYLAVLVPVIAGLFAAMGFATLAGLPKPQRVAVSIETAYQNTGIALAVTLSLGSEGRAAAIVPLVYGGYEAVCFGAYAVFAWYIGWTLSPPDESFWVIIYKSYQDTIDDHPHYKGHKKSKPDNKVNPDERKSVEVTAAVDADEEENLEA